MIPDEVAADGVLMVTKCPLRSAGSEHQIKCEYEGDILLSRIPVYESDSAYITYKNVYCALCNDVALSRLLFWEIEIQCDFIDNIDVVANYNSSLCVTYFVFRTWEERTYRWCTTNMIETCPEFYHSNKSVIDMKNRCENGQTGPIMIGTDSYKNEDCWICNTHTLTESVIEDLIGVEISFENRFGRSVCLPQFNPCYDELPFYSLQQLVNLNIEDTNYNKLLLRSLKESNNITKILLAKLVTIFNVNIMSLEKKK